MINRINELRNKAIERANYYSNIDFPNLANEFTELVNILNEMENIIKEKEELKARVQVLEEKASEKTIKAAPAPDLSDIPDEAAVFVGSILQSYGEEERCKNEQA